MKVSEELEWNYSHNCDNGELTEKSLIPQYVAAQLFIPIVEELYDNNIFTNWSGLEGNAHIRIPLDALSPENLKKALEFCKTNPNWILQEPPYKDDIGIASKYSIEIKVEYIENETDVMEVIDKLQQQIRKLDYQDVPIAPDEIARKSTCLRFSFEGLCEKAKIEAFDPIKQKYFWDDEDCPKSIEETIKEYCSGENPLYYYDETSKTFFRSKELLEKSIKYRQKQKENAKNGIAIGG